MGGGGGLVPACFDTSQKTPVGGTLFCVIILHGARLLLSIFCKNHNEISSTGF